MKGTMVSKGVTVGTIDETFAAGQLVLPPKTAIWTSAITMHVALSLDAIKIVLTAPGGAMVVDVTSTMQALVGGYPINISYNQNGLTVEKVSSIE
jgi:hypothetical protein